MSIFDAHRPFRMLSKTGRASIRKLRILEVGESIINDTTEKPEMNDEFHYNKVPNFTFPPTYLDEKI